MTKRGQTVTELLHARNGNEMFRCYRTDMHFAMPKLPLPICLLLLVAVISAALMPVIVFTYSYDRLSAALAWGSFCLLLGLAGVLWFYGRRAGRLGAGSRADLLVGLLLGGLWAVEIGLNNFLAPPLPGRDIMDNVFWAVIALSILAWAGYRAYCQGSLRAGLAAGGRSGLASGLVACGMALAMIVFGMSYLTGDPVNLAEWAALGAGAPAPTMAAYFAYETLAGAMGHLLVLGVLMGLLLGGLGGVVGKGLRALTHFIRSPR